MGKWWDFLLAPNRNAGYAPARPARPEPMEPPEPPQMQRAYLDDDDIENLVDSLDYERIHRAMLLFDVRWENAGKFEVPDEDAIHAYVGESMRKTIDRGRCVGMATTVERGFEFSHALTGVGREFASLQYILTSARNPK